MSLPNVRLFSGEPLGSPLNSITALWPLWTIGSCVLVARIFVHDQWQSLVVLCPIPRFSLRNQGCSGDGRAATKPVCCSGDRIMKTLFRGHAHEPASLGRIALAYVGAVRSSARSTVTSSPVFRSFRLNQRRLYVPKSLNNRG